MTSVVLALIVQGGAVHAVNGPIAAVQVDEPPKLDGDVSDACWQQASRFTDFYYLPDGSSAPESTTAWLCYDQKNVYVAFQCKDSQPDKIVAQQKKRGGDVSTDDRVEFNLDCYCTFQHSKNSVLGVTAGGIQYEQLQSGDVTKIEWKGDWNAAARRVEDGYTVEMAVPFSILQYDHTSTAMAVGFYRGHARTKQEWWSPDIGKGFDPKNFYLWEGLKLPRPRTRPLSMAYSLFGTGGDDSPRRFGLDIKHAITPSMTGLLAFNPDFRNVEQVVESVDFTYTERRYPDSRPFFEEGEMYFPPSEMFYSRRIGEIDYGGKLTGRYGDYQVGALHCGSLGEEAYSVAQIGREWPAKGNVRIVGVHGSVPGNDYAATSISAGYRIHDRKDLKMHLQGRVSTADSAWGPGRAQFSRYTLYNSGRPRVLAWEIGRLEIDPDFDPPLGYVPEKGIKGWELWARLQDEPALGKTRLRELNFSADLFDNMDSSPYKNSFYLNYYHDFRKGTSFWLNGGVSDRPPYHDRDIGCGYNWGQRDLYHRGGFGVSIGKKAGGRYFAYGFGQALTIGRGLNLDVGYSHSRIDPPSPNAYSASQVITSLAYDLDAERTIGGRTVISRGDANVFLTYRQRVRAGLDVWLIFGDPNAQKTRSSLLLKLVRPF
jgi:hypothetical protein